MGMSDNGELQDWIMLMLSAKLSEDHERFLFSGLFGYLLPFKIHHYSFKAYPPRKRRLNCMGNLNCVVRNLLLLTPRVNQYA